MLEGRSIIRC